MFIEDMIGHRPLVYSDSSPYGSYIMDHFREEYDLGCNRGHLGEDDCYVAGRLAILPILGLDVHPRISPGQTADARLRVS